MLYDDFHITKLPLLPEEVYDIYIATLLLIIPSYWWSAQLTIDIVTQVTGVEALKSFSGNFISPFEPSITQCTPEELEQRVTRLKEQLNATEAELERVRKGKQKI